MFFLEKLTDAASSGKYIPAETAIIIMMLPSIWGVVFKYEQRSFS